MCLTDTEIQRVCRPWKAFSDTHSNSRAIVGHFPTAAEGDPATNGFGTLCFRRWLCYERNIAVEIAQNAVRCCEVTTWDIVAHTVVPGKRIPHGVDPAAAAASKLLKSATQLEGSTALSHKGTLLAI